MLGKALKYPFAIQYNLTYRCNLRCVYCDCGGKKHENYEMSTTEIKSMLDQFVAMGTRRVSFTGGEPLLQENLPEIVNHAKSRGLFVSVASNGVLLPRRIKELKAVDSFNITLDGPEALNDLQRGQGSYQKVLQALRAVREAKQFVYLNCVLTRHNAEALPEILELARELKIKILIQPVFYSAPSHAGNLSGYESVKYEDTVLLRTLDELIALKQRRDPLLLLSQKYYEEVRHYLLTGRKLKCSYAKEQGALFCTISPEGYVTPCNLLVRDARYHNGLEMGFAKAFREMPQLGCAGCISSFIDIDHLLTLDQAVLLNYVRHSV